MHDDALHRLERLFQKFDDHFLCFLYIKYMNY